MLVAFLIMLREGIEAALIVGIVASYLAQTGRSRFLPGVWAGVMLAVGLSLALGVILNATSQEFPQKQQELFEGIVAFAATAVLTSMIFWMRRAARSIKAELQSSVDAALRSADGQGLALVGLSFFAVGREGLESVFFLLATFQQSTGFGVPAGAVFGVVCAVGVGCAIYLGGLKLDLRRFFRWTGVFIVFVAAGLLANGLKSFHEAGVWNLLQAQAFDLSDVLPDDSVLGTLLSALLGYQEAPTVGAVAIYLAYIIPTLWIFFTQARPATRPRTV